MEDEIVQLNVGGSIYTTTCQTLLSETNSYFVDKYDPVKRTFDFQRDAESRLFIDRDGGLFRFVIEYLRNKLVILPDNFTEKRRLKCEAQFYKLLLMIKQIEDSELLFNGLIEPLSFDRLKIRSDCEENNEKSLLYDVPSTSSSRKRCDGCIVVGYRGKF